MISLDFESVQSPADFTPGYIIPTGFDAGETTMAGVFINQNTVTSSNAGWISSTLSGANLYAETTWADSANGSSSRGPIFVNSSGNGYVLLVRSSDVRFFLLNGGSLTQIGADIAQSSVAGDVIRLAYGGSGAFSFHHNGTEIGSATDATVTSGLAPGFISRINSATIESFAAGALALPTLRKGSQFTVEETLAGTVVSATLNGNAITVDSHVGTTVTLTDTGSGITTSGEYPLVLTDDTAATETITVQVNVVGLASFNINKDGADQASLADVEFLILTGAAGSRAINDQIINVTTTAGGDTGPIEITDTALNSGDTIMVAQRSDSVAGGGGAYHPATLELI